MDSGIVNLIDSRENVVYSYYVRTVCSIVGIIFGGRCCHIVRVAASFRKGREIVGGRDANTLLAYVAAGLLYLVMTYVITKLFELIEKKVQYEE